MSRGYINRVVCTLALLFASGTALAGQTPVGTAFTYQGDLQERGTPVDGTANLEFSLWDDPTDTDPEAQLGRTRSKTVYVEEGQFNVILDFGKDVFSGNAHWLEIAMCSPAPCRDFSTLTPRRELSPTAYALLPSGGNENLQGPETAPAPSGPPVPPGLAKHFWALKGNDDTIPGTNQSGPMFGGYSRVRTGRSGAARTRASASSMVRIGAACLGKTCRS